MRNRKAVTIYVSADLLIYDLRSVARVLDEHRTMVCSGYQQVDFCRNRITTMIEHIERIQNGQA